MKKIAVVLSGCGFLDGAEINEAILTLLAIDKNNANYQCFAPDIPQLHVINHLTGNIEENETRNCLVEAARIARQDVIGLSKLKAVDYDAIIFPGGFGAAKNLCDFALKGAEMTVNFEVERVMQEFKDANKPAGFICIAPAMIAKVYGSGITCTIGNDQETVAGDIVIDSKQKVISTPAYMLAKRISESATGIEKLVVAILKIV